MPRSLSLALYGVALVVSLVACSTPAPEPSAGEWPQFRGPGGQGISSEAGLPERWGPDSPNLRWRAPIPGSGNSSPVISRGRVFLTTVYERPGDSWGDTVGIKKAKRVVLAYDLATGERLWETVLFEGPVGRLHWSNTHATPTPATDGRHLYVSFDAHLAALDLDGGVLWHRDLDPDFYTYSHYGAASSPVLTGDAVVLLSDREEGEVPDPGWIAAFDKQTGRELWRDEWTHTCCSYSTPLVVERAERTEIWNQTALEVVAYDARTGERLWRAEHPSSQTVPSLVRAGELFSTPGGMHTHAIEMWRLAEGDREARPERLWSSRKGVPEISSPVLYRGRIFSVARSGVLYVRDAVTGEVLSRRRLPWGNYSPSIVAGDGKVYVFTEEGRAVVLGVSDDGVEVLRHNRLPGGSGASPALGDGALFVRGKGELFRVDGDRLAAGAADPNPDDAT